MSKGQRTDKLDLGRRIADAISRHSLLKGSERILVGLSGGPDSVCLLHLLLELKGVFSLSLHAAYVDHNLRPAETPREAEFCRTLCSKVGVGFTLKSIRVAEYAKIHGLNRHEAARRLRYAALEEVAAETGSEAIALGHNADDQVETVVMRLVRGAGAQGLAGIPVKRGKIIRPMLEIDRKDIEEYLSVHELPSVVDSSNLRQDYFRNRIRQTVIPGLKEINPNLNETIRHTVAVLAEEERFFGVMVTKTLMKLISRKRTGRIELFLTPLEGMETVILRRVLRRAVQETQGIREIGFTHIEDIMHLVKKGSAGDRLYLPKGIRAVKEYSLLVITSEPPAVVPRLDFLPPGELVVPGTGFVVKATSEDSGGDRGDGKTSVVLDADLLSLPLVVRSRQEGDFFYPLGFGKRKKLQDFFVDMKVPRDERDAVPIVVSGEDIVWVAGYRADHRFRVTPETEKSMRFVIVRGKF
jgi:tRNA(Ile)-lysidine synthase